MTIDLDAPEPEWRAFIEEEMLRQLEMDVATIEREILARLNIPLAS